MYAVDLHAHSRFFHAWPGSHTPYDPVGLRTLALVARARGIDAIVVTNHDYAYPDRPTEIAGVRFLPGIEVSTSDGHVLVIGPDPPRQTVPRDLSAPETVDLAHERDCVAILAHPFRGSRAHNTGADFDAVEINGKNPENAGLTREFAIDRDLPLVGGSDAHYPPELGRVYTEIDCSRLTLDSVVDAVREGRVSPVSHYDAFQRSVSAVYSVVHRAKGYK